MSTHTSSSSSSSSLLLSSTTWHANYSQTLLLSRCGGRCQSKWTNVRECPSPVGLRLFPAKASFSHLHWSIISTTYIDGYQLIDTLFRTHAQIHLYPNESIHFVRSSARSFVRSFTGLGNDGQMTIWRCKQASIIYTQMTTTGILQYQYTNYMK